MRLDRDDQAAQRALSMSTNVVDAAEAQVRHANERIDSTPIDASDPASVDRYNTWVDLQVQRAREYNALLGPHHVLLEKHNALADAFNASCADKAYLTADWRRAASALESTP